MDEMPITILKYMGCFGYPKAEYSCQEYANAYANSTQYDEHVNKYKLLLLNFRTSLAYFVTNTLRFQKYSNLLL